MVNYHTAAGIVEHVFFHRNRALSLLAPHICGDYIQVTYIPADLWERKRTGPKFSCMHININQSMERLISPERFNEAGGIGCCTCTGGGGAVVGLATGGVGTPGGCGLHV